VTPASPSTHDTDTARHWIARLASGGMTPAEMARFKSWLAEPSHRAAFESERGLWQALEGLGPAFEVPHVPPVAGHAAARRRFARPRALWAGAAMLALGLAVGLALPQWGWGWRLQADHHTAAAVQAVALPDGTQVMLDAESAIAVRYGDHERRVELLRGRAWFQVAPLPGRPFRVAALGGVAEDIGTAFEVSLLDGGRVQASVSVGAVRLAADAVSPGVQLRQGMRASYAPGGPVSEPQAVRAGDVAAWRQGELLLDRVAVDAAIREVARYRSGPVWVLGDLGPAAPVTAVFRTERPDEALQALAGLVRARVTVLPGGAMLLRPPR
jgi:transmembrane sensor